MDPQSSQSSNQEVGTNRTRGWAETWGQHHSGREQGQGPEHRHLPNEGVSPRWSLSHVESHSPFPSALVPGCSQATSELPWAQPNLQTVKPAEWRQGSAGSADAPRTTGIWGGKAAFHCCIPSACLQLSTGLPVPGIPTPQCWILQTLLGHLQ